MQKKIKKSAQAKSNKLISSGRTILLSVTEGLTEMFKKLESLDWKFDGLAWKFETQEARIAGLENRIEELEAAISKLIKK